MLVELWDMDRVKPYEKNPRKNDAAVDAVVRSIKEFGFRQPIVVDAAGIIIVGHTRWKAAKKLGLKQVPVHIATELTPAQAKAYRIADNQTATISAWDLELLPLELSDLKSLDFDLDLLGFGEEELAAFMSGDVAEGQTDPDDVPGMPDAATTQPGDLWVLGNHRLLCGGSSKTEDVDRLLDGATIALANTDPPYNVRVEPRSNNAIAAGLSSFQATTHHQRFPDMELARHPEKAVATHQQLRARDRPLANDFVSDAAFDQMLDAWFGNIARVLAARGEASISGAVMPTAGTTRRCCKRHGLYFSQAIIWVKEHPVLTRKDFMGNHEWCFYGWKEGAAHKFYGPANVYGRLVGQEGEPAEHGAFDGETR